MAEPVHDGTQDDQRLWRFPGGLRLAGRKEMSTRSPIRPAPMPAEFVLPLQQHVGEPAEPTVAVGDRVLKGQPVARASAYVSAAIHAPTSGRVTAVGHRLVPHPSGLMAECIVIEPDGEDAPADTFEAGDDDPLSLPPDELRRRLRRAGIVGLGGAAFPTYVKLHGGSEPAVDRLILNGAECEPYISCDEMLMRERADEVVAGARVMMHAVQAARCQIAVEDSMPQAREALAKALANTGDDRIEIVEVPTCYPEGGENQLVQVLTGREVPADGLPLDIGIISHNVGTAAAVWQATRGHEPLISRIVTVTGRGVAEPANLEVRIGTPIATIIEACGGYTEGVERLIMGGPMMGFALTSDEVPVVKATNCVLAAHRDEVQVEQEPMPCIRCGECAQVCPASLLPQQIYWHARARDLEQAEEHKLFDCIECGCCDYVCPSHIPLVQYFRAAKTEIWAREHERRKADHARERYEFRQQRLERQRAEREQRLRRKQEALQKRKRPDKDPGKEEIEAVMERVRRKKNQQNREDGDD